MNKFLLMLALISTAAYGEWTKTGIGVDSSIYVDKGTMKRSGDLIRITYLQNFSLGTTSDDGKMTYKSSRTVEEFNCKKGESRTASFEWFSDVMGGGKQVYRDVHTYPFEKVDEESLVGSVMRGVCG